MEHQWGNKPEWRLLSECIMEEVKQYYILKRSQSVSAVIQEFVLDFDGMLKDYLNSFALAASMTCQQRHQ
jgi:hypothetical protein